MADKQVVRQDIIQIIWDVEESPIGKITGEANKLKSSITKAVGTSENRFDKLTKSVKNTQKQFKGATADGNKFSTAVKNIAKTSLTKVESGLTKLKTGFTNGVTNAKKMLSVVKDLGNENLKKLSTSLDNVVKKLGTGAVTAAKKAAKAIAAITIAGGAGIFKMTDMASDLSETLNKVDVSFGSSSDTVKKWAKSSITDMGLAEQTALDMAALFGDMGTGMGISQKEASKMSMELTQLGADLASFKNMDIAEVTTALNGVFTGETESLKRLGIVMTQTNLEAFAMAKGLTKPLDQMTESEKVMLRYEYVLSKTKNAQGDFARTGGGFANQLRMVKEQIKQIGTTIGGVFIGGFEKALKKVNDFGAQLNAKLSEVFADGFQFSDIAEIAPLLGPVGNAIQTIADKIQALTSDSQKMQLIKSVFSSIKTAVSLAAQVVGQLATKIWDFITSTSFLETAKSVIDGISKALKFVKDHMDGVITTIAAFAGAFATVYTAIKLAQLGIAAYNLVTGIMKAKQMLATGATIAQAAAQWGLNAALLASPITWIVVGIAALIAIIIVLVRNWDKVKGAATTCWNAIKNAFGKAADWFSSTVVEPVKSFFSDLWNSITTKVGEVKDTITGAFQSAWDTVTGIWSGITDFFSNLWDGVKNIVGKIVGKGKEASGGKADNNYRGGLITSPTLSWVGEKGAEMIIPLTGYRKRALSLWKQAGNMLGANVSPTVSLPSYSPASSTSTVSNSSSHTNNYSPQFTLNLSGTVDRTTERTVKQWVREALEETFDSMSRTSPRLTEV